MEVNRKLARRNAVASPLGALLRDWRATRQMSQLRLALEADVSPRHLSYIETGKSRASRTVVMRLADALALALRDRNALLLAAGFAPEYPETELASPELAQARRALDFILDHQEPFPAFVMNRYWDVLLTNRAAARLEAFLLGRPGPHNMVRTFFDPDGMRSVVVNWEEVAGDLLRHLYQEIAATPADARLRQLLDDVLSCPGVPARWHTRTAEATAPPLLTVRFRKDDVEPRFFSTIATFGTPRDVTLEELRVECTFPADEDTATFCRALARGDPRVEAAQAQG